MGDNSELSRRHQSPLLTYISDIVFWPVKRKPSSSVVVLLFLCILLAGAVVLWTTASNLPSDLFHLPFSINKRKLDKKIIVPLNCSNGNLTTCPNTYPATFHPIGRTTSACPDYFRWIHEDLRPWKTTGVTRNTLIRSRKKSAHFKLVIVKGKAYVEKYKSPFQTRDIFTIWGIVQLLRLYPRKLPDLEIMFWCGDRPVIDKKYYDDRKFTPPPVFHYCADESSLDIVFPDWTFWGWAETNIRPWGSILKEIKEGNNRTKWKDRVPYAYWKGNPSVSLIRGDLMKCNTSMSHDWKAHLYKQEWSKESTQGFKHSNLGDQCTHRYKIYIEGWAWSVSDKFIMACDSMTLLVKPKFYDFFIRSLVPLQHYLPINPNNKCRDIKFAVEWGNNHTDEAEAIAKEGSGFVHESLKMKYVYDYMFHVLSEYAKLMKFKPEIPKNATEVCAESMACNADGVARKFMEESLVKSPSDDLPCTLPPPYDPSDLKAFIRRNEDVNRKVEMWERQYWDELHNEQ